MALTQKLLYRGRAPAGRVVFATNPYRLLKPLDLLGLRAKQSIEAPQLFLNLFVLSFLGDSFVRRAVDACAIFHCLSPSIQLARGYCVFLRHCAHGLPCLVGSHDESMASIFCIVSAPVHSIDVMSCFWTFIFTSLHRFCPRICQELGCPDFMGSSPRAGHEWKLE